jgi:hypothetical protein
VKMRIQRIRIFCASVTSLFVADLSVLAAELYDEHERINSGIHGFVLNFFVGNQKMKNIVAFFVRSLPNWLNLKASSSSSSAVTEDETEDQVMSEDELRMMNAKESSILTSNLSTSESHVASSEIISDITLLRALGHLCESMVSVVLIFAQMFWCVS